MVLRSYKHIHEKNKYEGGHEENADQNELIPKLAMLILSAHYELQTSISLKNVTVLSNFYWSLINVLALSISRYGKKIRM